MMKGTVNYILELIFSRGRGKKISTQLRANTDPNKRHREIREAMCLQ